MNYSFIETLKKKLNLCTAIEWKWILTCMKHADIESLHAMRWLTDAVIDVATRY